MKARKSGFMLILCLLILSLLLVSGMGLMSVQKFRHRALGNDVLALQALQLAQAGLENARIKMERDQFFPPHSAGDQLTFTFSEDIVSGGVRVGSYFLTVDKVHAGAPYYTILLTSTGSVGPRDAPLAQRTLHAEMDKNPANSTYWHWTNWQDDGSL